MGKQTNVELWTKLNFFEKSRDSGSKHSLPFFQVKEEFANDASSPTVDSAAQPNGLAESDSNADNVPYLLLQFLKLSFFYAKAAVTCLTYAC